MKVGQPLEMRGGLEAVLVWQIGDGATVGRVGINGFIIKFM